MVAQTSANSNSSCTIGPRCGKLGCLITACQVATGCISTLLCTDAFEMCCTPSALHYFTRVVAVVTSHTTFASLSSLATHIRTLYGMEIASHFLDEGSVYEIAYTSTTQSPQQTPKPHHPPHRDFSEQCGPQWPRHRESKSQKRNSLPNSRCFVPLLHLLLAMEHVLLFKIRNNDTLVVFQE